MPTETVANSSSIHRKKYIAIPRVKKSKELLIFISGIFLAITSALVLVLLPLADSLGLISLLVGFTLTILLAARNEEVRNQLVLAFVFRAVLALVQFYVISLPESTADAISFESQAWQYAQSNDLLSNFTTGAKFYPWLISFLYAFTDRSPLMMQAVNVFIGTSIVFHTYEIANILWGKRAAYMAAWLTAFFPTLVLRSAITLRETFFVFFVSLGAVSIVRWNKKNSTTELIKSYLCFIVASLFHTIGFFLIIAEFSIMVLSLLKKRVNASSITQLLLALLLIVTVIVTGIGMDYLQKILNASNPTEIYFDVQISATGRTSYPSFLLGGSSIYQIAILPIRTAYFLFAPFIWGVRSITDMMGLFESILFLWMFYYIFKKNQIAENNAALLLRRILIITVILTSFGVNNIGTGIRHRGKILPIVIALSSEGISVFFDRYIRRRLQNKAKNYSSIT